MVYVYRSDTCRNCGRHKSEPRGRYCADCIEHRCGEYENGEQCRLPQAYADTWQGYQGYCVRHIRQRTTCPRCWKHPKEPWEPHCALCAARLAAAASRAQIREWRAEGTLCPSCRKSPQRSPQRLCEACLIARGVPLLQPPVALLDAVQEISRGWLPVPPLSVPKRLKGPRIAYARERKYKPRYWSRRLKVRRDGTPIMPQDIRNR